MSVLGTLVGRMSLNQIRVYPTRSDDELLLFDVLDRAAELGIYSPLKPSDGLSQALCDLEIPVLDYDDVQRYKASQLRFKSRWWKWFQRNMSAYKEEIPIHVVAKAVEIRTRVPSAYFTVHSLEFDRAGYERYKADPFLEVSVWGHKGYFIEVWEEPAFKGDFTEVRLRKQELPKILKS